MDRDNEIRISVRELVEFAYRSGDLDSRFGGMSRAQEGASLHRKLQRLNSERAALKGESYQKELSIACKVTYKGLKFIISGRIDGIMETERGTILDEIKTIQSSTSSIDEDTYPVHWAQAECYAYMYAAEKQLETVIVQITYCNTDGEDIRTFSRTYALGELEEFFFHTLEKYCIWAEMLYGWHVKRDESIKALAFPYEEYRKNQRSLAVAVYKTIDEGKRIYVQAPTGTGKTISALFPALKALGEGKAAKLFYLTAKTITRQVALDALQTMKDKGLRCKALVLTAKEKICFKEEPNCNPEFCEYAKGYFDRANEVVREIFEAYDIITRDIVEKHALQSKVCPFELSLDLALCMDCIICDYNYVFDPRASLKRFFDERENKYALLVDEAHNMVDRAREMFSAKLDKKPFLDMKRAMKLKDPNICKAAGKINSFMLALKKKYTGRNCCIQETEVKEIYPLLRELVEYTDEWLSKNPDSGEHKAILELYFEMLAFQRVGELYDEGYAAYIEHLGNDVMLKLFCLDPSKLLKQITERMGSSVFFSATLTPLNYFKDILGGDNEDYTARFPSPFCSENLLVAVAENISTKYGQREKSVGDVIQYIKAVADGKPGNYLVFFPSYKYMNTAVELFSSLYPDIDIVIQQPSLQEDEKELFLQNFKEGSGKPFVGFAVMGGMFSEGIDLIGDRLLGAVIVGVGLPQVCFERDIVAEYFRGKNSKGFEYAYMYPGMNKVLQASGRVIRSEADKGVVLLIDERFSNRRYIEMFPEEWKHNVRIRNHKELGERLKEFWKRPQEQHMET